jgi:hypothetical protein
VQVEVGLATTMDVRLGLAGISHNK